MKAAGVRWLRFGLDYPFKEQPGVFHEHFESRLAQARRLGEMGFGILGSTGAPGSFGLDGYFGSWQSGAPQDWVAYIAIARS